MTVKSAMNDCSPQNHAALWSPCCGGWNRAGSSYDDDDSGRPQLPDGPQETGTKDLTSRRCLRHQSSPSAGRRQPVNGCLRYPADVGVTKQFLRYQRLRVQSPSEVAVRRTLPLPAEACTTRQPAVVSHTVHSREIDKPLPQLAVAPPRTSSIVPRSAPVRRRHLPDTLGNSSSSSKATQTTATASQNLDELSSSRGIVDDDDEVAFLPHLSRPCSAPRMSDSSAFNRACRPPTSSSEAALVNELAARGRHTSLERVADVTDGTGAFELLSRFQSTTFASLSHVDVEVDDDDDDRLREPRVLFDSDVATAPGSNNFRVSDDRDMYNVFATSTERASLPSDATVRWTIAGHSVPNQVCHNLNNGQEVRECEENELFIDEWPNNNDDSASVSSASSAVVYPPSSDLEVRLLACSSGRHMTSTPMAGMPACHRVDLCNEEFSEIPRHLFSTLSDNDNDGGAKQVRECNPGTVRTSSPNCDNAVADVDALDGCAEGQQRRRVVMYYPPQAFKFYIEQHMENVMKAYDERRRHRAQLEEEMERLALPDDARTQMRRMLFQKESYHNRLRRTRMDRSAFRPIAVLGRGAFADVTLVRKRDSGALYAMKRLRKSDVLRNRQAAHVKAERDILAEADNEWIVRLFYSFQDATHLYFVMEYIAGGDLMGLLIRFGVFDELLSQFFVSELVLAIESVHRMGFIHRDIKPDNVLIDRRGHIKLTDFGLCTGFRWTHDSSCYHRPHGGSSAEYTTAHATTGDDSNSRTTNDVESSRTVHDDKNWSRFRRVARSLVGTPNYIAPEVLSQSGYTACCDWWSVGVILYEMRIGRPPFYANTRDETQMKVLHWASTLHIPNVNNLRPTTRDLITRLLCDQRQRLGRRGADELKRHAYFDGVSFENIRRHPAPYIPAIAHPADTSNFDVAEPIQSTSPSVHRSPPSRSETSGDDGDGHHAFLEFTFRRFFDDDEEGRVFSPLHCFSDETHGTVNDALYV